MRARKWVERVNRALPVIDGERLRISNEQVESYGGKWEEMSRNEQSRYGSFFDYLLQNVEREYREGKKRRDRL